MDPILPEVTMHACTPASPTEGVVVSNERCTAGRKPAGFVRHVVIDTAGTPLAGTFVAGQSFGILPPGNDARGHPHKVRLYSLASPRHGEDGRGTLVATTVKRLIDEHHESGKLFLGVASNYLCDAKPGDRVRLTGPSGKRFVLPADPGSHDYVFFATGTGIAPFRGMLKELFESPGRAPHAGRVTLVMGCAYASDLLYDQELRAMAASHAGFRYLTAISRETQETSAGRRTLYVQDQIGLDPQLKDLLGGERTLVYVCGIAGMELGILRAIATELRDSSGVRAAGYLEWDAQVGDGIEAGAPSGSTVAAGVGVGAWTRRMLHKQVRPTRRVFLEVY
ncbi:MAG: hypothetical protein AABZ53_05425 [Planctomycetota bacterium]